MLHQRKRLDLILPDPNLSVARRELATYWSRYRDLYPDHDVFQILQPNELELCLPIKLHGDEGRSNWTLIRALFG